MIVHPLEDLPGPVIVAGRGLEPERVAAAFARQRRPVFLDSSLKMPGLGRYSFLSCDPFLVMRSRGRTIELSDDQGTRRITGDPFDVLETLLARFSLPDDDQPVPFAGGAAGYLGYDLGRLIERLPCIAAPGVDMPEACLAFYDAAIAYDHQAGSAYLISTGLPAPEGRARDERARARLAWLEDLVADAADLASRRVHEARPGGLAWRSVDGEGQGLGLRGNFTREEYLRAVQRAREYIIAGDMYQVNLSQRFQAPWEGSPWELYAALREANPAPFAAFMDFGDAAVLSSSPERFLRLEGGTLETRPIKGTRPRGATPAEDAAFARELLASEKDAAEHIMIVDLERSDLGRVCQVGSVHVAELAALEPYATVFHLTSTIRGQRRRDRSLAQLLRATFPGGSITGAPKIRAMQIIEELEPTRRGVYTGAIGYFNFTGGFDLNIAIRTIVLQQGVATFQVGGGIVYDSDPEAEYQETLSKGRALVRALASAPAMARRA